MELRLHEIYRNIERDHWWFVGRRKILSHVLSRYLSKGSKILDIGCNSGVLVEILQNEGYAVCGTDISKEAVEYGKMKGIKNLFTAPGAKQPFLDQTFDCIMALDVIEHIRDDKEAMEEFARLLRPGGVMIIKVPAFMFMWGIQDEVAHHERRYTKKSLNSLINHKVFSVLRLTYFNFFLFIPIVISRLLQKLFKPKRHSDFDMNNKFLNRIFNIIFLFETKLLKFVDLSVGVSILMVLKKK